MIKKNEIQRINNIVGQLNGVQKMMERKKKCSDVLIQLSAIKSAIEALSNYVIENNFSECLNKSKKDKELKKIIKTLIKNN
jgi:DNA-binding FrmR family transcriptional regulator